MSSYRPKQEGFQFPDVEQPNEDVDVSNDDDKDRDGDEAPDSIEAGNGSQGWRARVLRFFDIDRVPEEDRCRLVCGLIAFGIIFIILITATCLLAKYLPVEKKVPKN